MPAPVAHLSSPSGGTEKCLQMFAECSCRGAVRMDGVSGERRRVSSRKQEKAVGAIAPSCAVMLCSVSAAGVR